MELELPVAALLPLELALGVELLLAQAVRLTALPESVREGLPEPGALPELEALAPLLRVAVPEAEAAGLALGLALGLELPVGVGEHVLLPVPVPEAEREAEELPLAAVPEGLTEALEQ